MRIHEEGVMITDSWYDSRVVYQRWSVCDEQIKDVFFSGWFANDLIQTFEG